MAEQVSSTDKGFIFDNRFELGLPCLSLNRVRANAHVLVQFAGESDLRVLRASTMRALNRVQRISVPWAQESSEIILRCGEQGNARDVAALRALMVVDDLPEGWERHCEDVPDWFATTREAFDLIERELPQTYAGLTTLIGEIMFAWCPTHGGASVSSIIGTIWLNPRQHWGVAHYAESLIHEYIHHALFLEEMVHTIFTDELNLGEPTWVRSAILKKPRPYDRSFHSAFVAFGLSAAHRFIPIGTDQRTLSSGIAATIGEMRGKPACLTPHGHALVDELAAAVGLD